MKPRDNHGNELCGRLRTEVAKPWGSGHIHYRCKKPLGHKSREHMDSKYRWKEKKQA